MCHDDRFFELVDTGGMGIADMDNLTRHIEDQINLAIDSAAVILFVVDTRDGMLPLDQDVARRLRSVNVPIILIANKTDDERIDSQAAEFYRLGSGKPLRVSTHAEPQPGRAAEHDRQQAAAAAGRRSSGRRRRAGDEGGDRRPPQRRQEHVHQHAGQAPRMIVSEVPGTTRDSVDVRFELDGKPFIAIDTPGIRRAKSRQTDIDFYSTHRAQRSIRRADVVLLFFDATQRISKVDKQLCDYIAEQYKPCIFVVNKWDQLVEHDAHGKVGPLPARRVRHDALRADRVHHRPDRQEREGAAEPRPDAVQAVAGARLDRPAQPHAARRGATEPAAAGPAIASRRFTTPRRSASSRQRSCCSPTTRS